MVAKLDEARLEQMSGVKDIVNQAVKQAIQELSMKSPQIKRKANKKNQSINHCDDSSSSEEDTEEESLPAIQTTNKMYRVEFKKQVKLLCNQKDLQWQEITIGNLEKLYPKKVSLYH
jgi:hypothetical protein